MGYQVCPTFQIYINIPIIFFGLVFLNLIFDFIKNYRDFGYVFFYYSFQLLQFKLMDKN
jgi:hypothetical protein